MRLTRIAQVNLIELHEVLKAEVESRKEILLEGRSERQQAGERLDMLPLVNRQRHSCTRTLDSPPQYPQARRKWDLSLTTTRSFILPTT
jgi:hypothetical protein